MSRYFFHFHQGRDVSRDVTGTELADAELAYLAAYEAAVCMWSELLRERRDPRACAFDVRDEADRSIFVMPFTEVLDACRVEDRPVTEKCTRRSFADLIAARERTIRQLHAFRAEMRSTHAFLAEARSLIRAAGELETGG